MKSSAPLFSMLLGISATIWVARAAPAPKAKPAKLEGKIAFDSVRGRGSKIYVINADGTHQTPLTSRDFDGNPSFSSDGKQIAYVAQNYPETSPVIYLANADGTSVKRLTYILSNEFLPPPGKPCIAPDGTQIAFTGDDHGTAEIYRINADGKGETALTKSKPDGYFFPNSSSPSYSPDGKQIVFVSNRAFSGFREFSSLESSNEIYVMNADSTAQTRITHNDVDDSSPCFSPDGKHIAFVSVRDGKSQIYLMKADGTDAIRLTKENADSPCFSPDGKHIAYTSGSEQNPGIFVMNLDGTGQKRLADGSRPTWAPGFVPAPKTTKK